MGFNNGTCIVMSPLVKIHSDAHFRLIYHRSSWKCGKSVRADRSLQQTENSNKTPEEKVCCIQI